MSQDLASLHITVDDAAGVEVEDGAEGLIFLSLQGSQV